MAVTIEENDTAYALTETAIQKLAYQLDFTYVDTATGKQAARPSGPLQRYLFRALPHGAGVFAFEDVHIVCVADMSAMTFWEYINERFGTEREPIPKAKGVEITLDSDLLDRKEIRLPNDLKITISYARMLTGQCFEGNTFQVTHAAAQQSKSLARVYDEQSLSSTLASCNSTRQFPGIYLKFRHWAFCSGVLSRKLGYLSEENLQHMLASTLMEREASAVRSPDVSVEDLIGAISIHRNFNDPKELETSPGGRTISQQMSAGNFSTIEGTIAKRPSDEIDTHWFEAAWSSFTTEHNVFVQLRVRCWNGKRHQEAVDVLCDTALGLRAHLIKSTVPTGCRSARVWPHMYGSMSGENDEVAIVVGIMSFVDATRRHFVDDFLGQLQYDTSAFYISHDTLAKEQLPTPSLQSLFPKIRMPRNTPEVRPQLDTSSSAPSSGRFRTAGGVMERLRYDPAHASHDYEVGYVDRFEKDLIWKPLEKWEKMTEEEDFVPEHRIRQVRKKADGMIVWDREKRLDRTDEV